MSSAIDKEIMKIHCNLDPSLQAITEETQDKINREREDEINYIKVTYLSCISDKKEQKEITMMAQLFDC